MIVVSIDVFGSLRFGLFLRDPASLAPPRSVGSTLSKSTFETHFRKRSMKVGDIDRRLERWPSEGQI